MQNVWVADQFWKMVETIKRDVITASKESGDEVAKVAETAVLLAILREAYPAGSA